MDAGMHQRGCVRSNQLKSCPPRGRTPNKPALIDPRAKFVCHKNTSRHRPRKIATTARGPCSSCVRFVTLRAMATQTHQGGCHCGAVRYEVELDLDQPAIACDCSICSKSGTLLQFVEPSKFRLERGEENLSDYQFNQHVIHHLFCKTCGIKSFARGVGPHGPMVAINVRALDGVDVFALRTQQYPGRLS